LQQTTTFAAAADNEFYLDFCFQPVLCFAFCFKLKGKLILSGIIFNAMLDQNKEGTERP